MSLNRHITRLMSKIQQFKANNHFKVPITPSSKSVINKIQKFQTSEPQKKKLVLESEAKESSSDSAKEKLQVKIEKDEDNLMDQDTNHTYTSDFSSRNVSLKGTHVLIPLQQTQKLSNASDDFSLKQTTNQSSDIIDHLLFQRDFTFQEIQNGYYRY